MGQSRIVSLNGSVSGKTLKATPVKMLGFPGYITVKRRETVVVVRRFKERPMLAVPFTMLGAYLGSRKPE